VIDESDLQHKKHPDPRISTLFGIKIDWNDENENASDSIRFNCEFDSNLIDASDLHNEKHDEPRISIVRPTSIAEDSEKFRINLLNGPNWNAILHLSSCLFLFAPLYCRFSLKLCWRLPGQQHNPYFFDIMQSPSWHGWFRDAENRYSDSTAAVTDVMHGWGCPEWMWRTRYECECARSSGILSLVLRFGQKDRSEMSDFVLNQLIICWTSFWNVIHAGDFAFKLRDACPCENGRVACIQQLSFGICLHADVDGSLFVSVGCAPGISIPCRLRNASHHAAPFLV
jgi:hypothetical protein